MSAARLMAAGRIRTNPETGHRELAEVVDLQHERGPLAGRRTLSGVAYAAAQVDVVGLALRELAERLAKEAANG